MYRRVTVALLLIAATLAPAAQSQALTPTRTTPHAYQLDGMVMGVSRPNVYPFVDKWADTVTLYVTATVPVTGEVQIINGTKRIFRTWPLTTTQSWRYVWDGTDSAGHVLPYGQYWARAVLDRGVGPTITLDNRIQVLSEAIASLTVKYMHKDVLGKVNNGVQGKGLLTVSRNGHVVYRKGLNWSVNWYVPWYLTSSSGHRLPPGNYTFTVTASGHQGPAKTVSKVFYVS
jgi:hypothetical protein